MKRTDITDLFPDAPKESIEKLMAINGADVNAVRGELESLRTQLEAAKTSPELQEAQQQIAQLTTELNGMKQSETIRKIREKVSTEKKIPADLLTGETEEACVQQADSILAFAQATGYPVLRDAGESSHSTQAKTRDKFAAWASENL